MNALRLSLVFVWIATALVSVWELHGQSASLLAASTVVRREWFDGVIWMGSAVDLVLGLLLWFWPRAWVYWMALMVTVSMTVLASFLLPDLWLHPLGPLTKNIPIAAILWVLARSKA